MAGESLLGLIMADHLAELTYLLSRPDMDDQRIGVQVSRWAAPIRSGWLRLKPGPKPAFPWLRPRWPRRAGACAIRAVRPDGGLYHVAWDDMIRSSVAPRSFLEIIPGCQRPISAEGTRLMDEAWINGEEAVQRYFLSDEQVTLQHP